MNCFTDGGLVFFYGKREDVYCTLFLKCENSEESLKFMSSSDKLEQFTESSIVNRLGYIFHVKQKMFLYEINKIIFHKSNLNDYLLELPVIDVAFDKVHRTFGIFLDFKYHGLIPVVYPYEYFPYDDEKFFCGLAQSSLKDFNPSIPFCDFDTILFLYVTIYHEGVFVHNVSEFISNVSLDLHTWYIYIREKKLEQLINKISCIDREDSYSKWILEKINKSIPALKDEVDKMAKNQPIKNSNINDVFKVFDDELKSCYNLLAKWNYFYSCKEIDVDYISGFNEYKPFYRGISRPYFNEIPKALRLGSDYDEKGRYFEIISRFPNDFTNKTFIESLMNMQHYELPTRLLDITRSPLVALYMACSNQYTKKEDNRYPGEINIYFPERNQIRYAKDMDVELLSSVLIMDEKEKRDLYRFLCTLNFKVNDAAIKYCNRYFFQTDSMTLLEDKTKPKFICDNDLIYCKQILLRFQNIVKLKFPGYSFRDFSAWNLFKTYYLIGENINERIREQAGSFILFGLDDKYINRFNSTKNGYAKRIFIENKESIVSELSMLNISQQTLTPDLVNVAHYISEH